MNSRRRYYKTRRTKGKKMFRSFNKRAHKLRVRTFTFLTLLLLVIIPSRLMAADVPFDTTPEPFQGSDRLVNFLNKFQFALIIILVIFFVLGFVKMRADHRAGRGIGAEATGIALSVIGIIVVSRPEFWINLIGSWFGG